MSWWATPLRCGGTRFGSRSAYFWICYFKATVQLGIYLIELHGTHSHCENKVKNDEKRLTLVPSGNKMVRQTNLSSRTVMHSSSSLSETSTVLQLTSSRAGNG